MIWLAGMLLLCYASGSLVCGRAPVSPNNGHKTLFEAYVDRTVTSDVAFGLASRSSVFGVDV